MTYLRHILVSASALCLAACASQPGSRAPQASICPAKVSANQASTGAPTVFGLPLGAQFSFPECERSSYGYSIGTSKLCFQRLWGKEKNTSPVCNETVEIRFPITESPRLVKGSSLLGLIIDGRLEGIGFNTNGYSSQAQDLAELTKKFGKPNVTTPSTVRNKLGGSFESVSAGWSSPNAIVTFIGILGKIDTGLVNIDTPKGSEHRSKALKELTKNPNPL